MDHYNVGKNDKYLITKLKSYNITIDKIDDYLRKLQDDKDIGQPKNM